MDNRGLVMYGFDLLARHVSLQGLHKIGGRL